MLFSEIPLFDAILNVRDEMAANGESAGADNWVSDDTGRHAITQRVMRHLLRDADQRIIDAWQAFRKGPSVAPSVKKIELTLMVARAHGSKCFYANRGRGPCSEDVHLDRIIPGSRGGQYTLANCILACGTHNSMRGDTSIEEFLSLPNEPQSM